MPINATASLYDLTNLSTSNNIYEFMKNVNGLTNDLFMAGMLFAGFVILFVSMKNRGNKEAFLASSFIISIMAIMFSVMDFIQPWVMYLFVIPFGIVFAISVVRRDF